MIILNYGIDLSIFHFIRERFMEVSETLNLRYIPTPLDIMIHQNVQASSASCGTSRENMLSQTAKMVNLEKHELSYAIVDSSKYESNHCSSNLTTMNQDGSISGNLLSSKLNYKLLVHTKAIPDIKSMFSLSSKRYPDWVTKSDDNIKEKYFIYCKNLFLKCDLDLRSNQQLSDLNVKSGSPPLNTTPWTRQQLEWFDLFNEQPPIGFKKDHKQLTEIIDFSQKSIALCPHQTDFTVNYDSGSKIKKTYRIVIDAISFQKNSSWLMKVDSGKDIKQHTNILQGLIEIAILRDMGYPCDWLLLTFLLQKEIKIVDLRYWNSKAFLNVISNNSLWLLDDFEAERSSPSPGLDIVHFSYGYPIGYHINLNGIFAIGFPFQLYLSNKLCSENRKVSEEKIEKIRKYILLSRLGNKDTKAKSICDNVFIHTPLNFNICNNENYISDLLSSELAIAKHVGANGIIVHMGSYTNKSVELAINIMEHNIRKILPLATENCPILLETSAGEKTDVCICPDELLNFISRFGNDKRIGICLDSCHVFSAGYDPVWYLTKIKKYVKVIHYNDSKNNRGCCHDEHAKPGYGHIGLKRMLLLKDIAANSNLPLIVE